MGTLVKKKVNVRRHNSPLAHAYLFCLTADSVSQYIYNIVHMYAMHQCLNCINLDRLAPSAKRFTSTCIIKLSSADSASAECSHILTSFDRLQLAVPAT
jgi:hypothetical protein